MHQQSKLDIALYSSFLVCGLFFQSYPLVAVPIAAGIMLYVLSR